MIEALSQGLSGHGRKNGPKRWGGNTFVQVLDPDFFAGREAFAEQVDYLSDGCRRNRPIRADRPVRVPGDQAARGVAQALAEGIFLRRRGLGRHRGLREPGGSAAPVAAGRRRTTSITRSSVSSPPSVSSGATQ